MALLCSTICSSFPSVTIRSRNVVCFTPIAKQKCCLKLSFFRSISTGFRSVIPFITNPPQKQSPSSLTVFAAKGYKRKTHKASAKRFRVTGTGKIIRRRAGKQHLLAKKNTKRKLRLSKLIQVNRSDYDNVIGALPYLKVKRQAKKVIPSETKTEIS